MTPGVLCSIAFVFVTYGAYQYSHALGWVVGGLCLFILAVGVQIHDEEKKKEKKLDALVQARINQMKTEAENKLDAHIN